MYHLGMTPSVGRIVHYVSRGSADYVYPATCRAAVVTEVDGNDRPSLIILNPTGIHFHEKVEHNEPGSYGTIDDRPTLEPGTWHWPEWVE